MSDQAQEQETKKKSTARPIGGIGQYATIGGMKRSDAQMSKRPDIETARSENTPIADVLDSQTARHLEVQTGRSPDTEKSKSSEIKKSKHPDWKQKTVYLPPHMFKWLNVQAAQEEREISEIVEQALAEYRARYEGRWS